MFLPIYKKNVKGWSATKVGVGTFGITAECKLMVKSEI